MEKSVRKLHPVVKWAGGKTQLITQISKRYPLELGKSITKYAEPFVGGGNPL
ncbi:MAG: DNA adenine methylase [Actinomycetaceae bacterium]|nr:DNA adenine methylase [Actinomycetaceae bacterium]